MIELHCDVAIIGAGTAGMAAERTARRAGAKTLLIDAGFSGTTCARVGCMPSKLLIAAAEAAQAVRQAGGFGIDATVNAIDGPAVMARVRRERDAFVAGVEEDYASLPDGVKIEAEARFTGPTSLALGDGRAVIARSVVIAVGAKPVIPKAFDGVRAHVITNEAIFELADLPASVGVIGAGPLGLELAQALARLGVEVMVFDEGDRIAALGDAEVEKALRGIIARDVAILLNVTVETSEAPGGARVRWSGVETGQRTFEKLLVATGRAPRVDALDLAKSGIPLDDHGTPRFDPATMQCGDSAVFIAGDADHARPVLHDAVDEGTIAGRNAAAYPRVERSHRTVPFSIMFTDPPLAVLGDIGPGSGIIVGGASYEDQGRAKITRRNAGLAHIFADAGDGRIVGAALACPAADHLGHLLAWAIEGRQTATQLLTLPIYHPTYEEGLKPALRAICAQVYAPVPQDRDDGFVPGA